MAKFHRPIFSKKTIYVDFKAQRNACHRCHGKGNLEENKMRKIYDGYLILWPNFVLI